MLILMDDDFHASWNVFHYGVSIFVSRLRKYNDLTYFTMNMISRTKIYHEVSYNMNE